MPTVSYIYDLTGRLTGVSDNSAAIVSAVPPTGMQSVAYGTSYTYDALNHRTGVIFRTVSAAATPSASQVTFQDHYDATNRRISQTKPTSSLTQMRPHRPLGREVVDQALQSSMGQEANLAADGTPFAAAAAKTA